MPVQADHEVVGDDGVAGGEERHQPLDQVPLGRRHALPQVTEVDLEVDLLHRPGVLDRTAIHLVEARIAHRPQGEVEAGIEQDLRCDDCAHWQASQVSGFSSEQTTARVSLASGCAACTVVLAICVAGRERR